MGAISEHSCNVIQAGDLGVHVDFHDLPSSTDLREKPSRGLCTTDATLEKQGRDCQSSARDSIIRDLNTLLEEQDSQPVPAKWLGEKMTAVCRGTNSARPLCRRLDG